MLNSQKSAILEKFCEKNSIAVVNDDVELEFSHSSQRDKRINIGKKGLYALKWIPESHEIGHVLGEEIDCLSYMRIEEYKLACEIEAWNFAEDLCFSLGLIESNEIYEIFQQTRESALKTYKNELGVSEVKPIFQQLADKLTIIELNSTLDNIHNESIASAKIEFDIDSRAELARELNRVHNKNVEIIG